MSDNDCDNFGIIDSQQNFRVAKRDGGIGKDSRMRWRGPDGLTVNFTMDDTLKVAPGLEQFRYLWILSKYHANFMHVFSAIPFTDIAGWYVTSTSYGPKMLNVGQIINKYTVDRLRLVRMF